MGHMLTELNVVHINIRGLKTSKTELELLINDIQPHIITINETHLRPNDRVNFSNYNIIRKDRRDRRGGGIAILYNRQLPASPVELPKQFDSCEALLAKIHIPNWPIYVSTIYNPPDSPLPTNLITHLASHHKSILISDINAHHPVLGDNPTHTNRQGRALVDILEQSNFQNTILPGPTRYPQTDNQIFSTPDKILATHPIRNRIQYIKIHEPPNSDHAPIQIVLNTPYWRPLNKPQTKQLLDYRNADWTKFNENLENTIPDITPKIAEDIDMYDQILLQHLQSAIRNSIPSRTIKTCKLQQRIPLPDYIIKTIKTKRRAHRLYIRTKTEANRRLYRKLQEETKAAIKLHNQIKYEQLTRKLQSEWTEHTKKFWQTISKLRGTKPTQTTH